MEEFRLSLSDEGARTRAAQLAELEASALAGALGAAGDELRFEDVTFTVSGSLAGAAFAMPLTARGVATFRARELNLVAVPALIRTVELPLACVKRVCMEQPMFGVRRVHARTTRGDLIVEAATDACTDAFEAALRPRAASAAFAEAVQERARTTGFRPTGRHFALIDPDAPETITLADEVE